MTAALTTFPGAAVLFSATHTECASSCGTHLSACVETGCAPLYQGGQHLISLVLPEQMRLDPTCSGSLTHAGMRAGMDIAAEVALCGAAKTILSCRRPVHVVPRWVFGKPSDTAVQPWCVLFYSSCIA